MSIDSIASFEHAVHSANEWLRDISAANGADGPDGGAPADANPQAAYHELRAVLHALRDRLTVDEAANLGAQLPLLIRGVYYENWRPSATPTTIKTRDEFLSAVGEGLDRAAPGADSGQATRRVFSILKKHADFGEIVDVHSQLPREVQELLDAA